MANIALVPLPSAAGLSSAARCAAYEALDGNIKNLPQELKNLILDHTLVATLPMLYKIVKKNARHYTIRPAVPNDPEPTADVVGVFPGVYKAPLALQLCSDLRETFAASYYGERQFLGPKAKRLRPYYHGDRACEDESLYRWHRALSAEHQGFIRCGDQERDAEAYKKRASNEVERMKEFLGLPNVYVKEEDWLFNRP